MEAEQARTTQIDSSPGAAALAQLLVSRACELARAGRFSAAESLLLEAMEAGGRSAASLDLLARIRAQQGRFGDAERLWQEALRQEPGHEGFAAGLRRIAASRRRSWWLRPLLLLAVALAVAAALLVPACQVVRSLDRLRESLDTPRPVAERPPRVERVAEEPLPAPPVEAPQLALDVPGLALRTEGSELVATFEAGLFARGTRLRPEARELLAALGEQLGHDIDALRVEIIGRTDARPVPAGSSWPDNAALGLARAAVAFEGLRRRVELPAEAFSFRTGGAVAPGSGSWRESARQRTVELRISRRVR